MSAGLPPHPRAPSSSPSPLVSVRHHRLGVGHRRAVSSRGVAGSEGGGSRFRIGIETPLRLAGACQAVRPPQAGVPVQRILRGAPLAYLHATRKKAGLGELGPASRPEPRACELPLGEPVLPDIDQLDGGSMQTPVGDTEVAFTSARAAASSERPPCAVRRASTAGQGSPQLCARKRSQGSPTTLR